VREHGTASNRRWNLVFRGLEKWYECIVTKLSDAELVTDMVRGVLVNILKLCRDAYKINSYGNYWNRPVEEVKEY
jgi:hypothetical protein